VTDWKDDTKNYIVLRMKCLCVISCNGKLPCE